MRIPPPHGWPERDTWQAIRELAAGRSNAVGRVTLTPSATTTTIVNDNINEQAEPFFFPRTASAAAELGAGTMFASISRVSGVNTVTITHANSAVADRTFAYIILGG